MFDKNNANILNNAYLNNSQSKIASGDGNKVLYISIEGGKTYTISKIASSRFAVATTSTLPSINTTTIDKEQDNSATHITLNTSINAKYLCVFYLYSADTINEREILNSIQIEKGSTATSYEPYGKVWYLNKQIGKVVLDGSVEEASINTSKTNTTRIVYTNLLNYNAFQDYSLSLCNRLICKNVWNNDNEGFYFDDNSKTLIMRMNKTIIGETISSLNTYLSANNFIFVYAMTEPIDTEITDSELIEQLNNLENAYSYDTQTNISQTNDDMPFILDVEAILSLKNILN